MYLNGMGLRGIERVTNIHHTTVMHWIREAGHQLHDAPESEEIPEVSDLDELQTFVGNKRNKLWIWTAVNHKQPGILAWVIGEATPSTKPLGLFKTSVSHIIYWSTQRSRSAFILALLHHPNQHP
jgi:hypothetical protein